MFERGRDFFPPSFFAYAIHVHRSGGGLHAKHDAVHRHESPAGASAAGLRIGDVRCNSYNFSMFQSLSGAAA